MKIWKEIRAFWQAFRAGSGSPPPRHSGHSLAKALRDSTHVRGGTKGMGLSTAGTEQHHKIVAEGHEQYGGSFKKKD